MFVDVQDHQAMRLIANAPGWPTLDELWALAPPTSPPPDDADAPDETPPRTGSPLGAVPFDPVPSGWSALDLDATTTDPRALTDVELIDAMAGFGRTAAWAQARQARLVAEFDRRRPGSAARYAPDEVALAMSMSRFSAHGLLERSRRLVDTLHATLAAYEAGRVDGFKVRVICDAVRHLDDAHAVWVQDQVLDAARHQSVAQLRAALARAVIAADPEGANERHRRARKDRRVGVGQEQDGMATVWAALAAQDAAQVFGTLTGLARSLGADDPRGMDARRADLLVGLMTGEIGIAFPVPGRAVPDSAVPESAVPESAVPESAVPESAVPESAVPDVAESGARDSAGAADDGCGEGDGSASGLGPDGTPGLRGSEPGRGGDPGSCETGRWATDGAAEACPICAGQAWRAAWPRLRPVNPAKPLVQVVIGHSTLRGADHAPAELVGYGAICADQAREIAGDAVWRRLVHDDLTGELLDHGRRTYRPPAALADHVRARDVSCRSPLCRRRAIDSELDHTTAFPHGPTAEPNLAAVCLLHHDEKHAPGWTVVQHPDGRIDWVTPTGHVYSSEVHDYRPLPPPPRPSIPGPIADRTDAHPTPAPRVEGMRGGYDWTDTRPSGSREPAPF